MGIGHGKILEVTTGIREFIDRYAFKAETIEGLALKIGVPVGRTFKATVARYNELASLGKDLDFGGERAHRLTLFE